MTLLMILLGVFLGIALMVILGERFAKPMKQAQLSTLSKIASIACFVLIISFLIRAII